VSPPARIGMLDWGVGGLDAYRQLKSRFPHTSFVYWSDTGVVPYGKMPANILQARVSHVIAKLVELGAERIVIACNAASTALPFIECPVPTTGVIEHGIGCVPDNLQGTLGILGGVRTIRSRQYQRGLARSGLSLVPRVGQPLSGHIEAGTTHSRECVEALDRILAPLSRVDALLLACTHYSALSAELGARAPHTQLLDPVPRLVDWVTEHWLLPQGTAPDRFITTGDPSAMQLAAARVWNLTFSNCEHVAVG